MPTSMANGDERRAAFRIPGFRTEAPARAHSEKDTATSSAAPSALWPAKQQAARTAVDAAAARHAGRADRLHAAEKAALATAAMK